MAETIVSLLILGPVVGAFMLLVNCIADRKRPDWREDWMLLALGVLVIPLGLVAMLVMGIPGSDRWRRRNESTGDNDGN